MSPLFRRDDSADTAAETAPAETLPPPLAKGQSAGKGRPTPKRKDTAPRRVVAAPPKSTKEAKQRRQERMRAERAERFEGARRGDDRYLLARDQGPVRRLVRDIVDSRRNVGPVFFTGTMVVMVLTTGAFQPIVRLAGNFVFFVLLVMLIMDSVIIGRRVKKVVWERHPDTKEKPRSLIFYGVLRSVSFRKIRNPSPQVKPGDTI